MIIATKALRVSFGAILALTLNACSVFQKEADALPSYQLYEWESVETKLNKIRAWKLLGKTGIRTTQESVTAAINQWVQVDDFFAIKLSSTFLGLGATSISGDRTHVILERSGEPPQQSDDPNRLIEEALGIPLPIGYITYWIRALPEPESSFERTFNPHGLPAQISQHGWQIKYKRYTEVKNTPLPSKIVMESESARIVIAIKEWQLGGLTSDHIEQEDY